MLKLIIAVTVVAVAVMLIIVIINAMEISKQKDEPEVKDLSEQSIFDKVLSEMMEKTVKALANAIEAKDSFTLGHSQRVANYAKEIAIRMGLNSLQQKQVYYCGLLHDVGKIRVPDNIVKKTGKYTDKEFSIVRLHPTTGYKILKGVGPDGVIEDAIKSHHEHFDGSGYPEGLKGKDIPLYARILRVCDTYDAMTSDRSFRNVFPQTFVKAEIENGIGKEFDPDIARHMVDMINEDFDYHMRQSEEPLKRILIVDDDRISRKIAESMLKKDSNYYIYTACDGEECIEQIKEMNFDLIILDLDMPKMNGFETLKRIKVMDDVSVIIMTADKDENTIQQMNEYGISYYLMKPFLREELLEAVRNVFN